MAVELRVVAPRKEEQEEVQPRSRQSLTAPIKSSEELRLLAADPLSYIGGAHIPLALRRNLHYALVCTVSFVLCAKGIEYFPQEPLGDVQLFNYLTPVVSLVAAQQTLGEDVVSLFSSFVVSLLVSPLGYAVALLEFSKPLLVIALFCVLMAVYLSGLSPQLKKIGIIIPALLAVTPALYGIKQDVPYELLKIMPSMALLLVAPLFPAMVATLLPAPSLAIFRAKRQLKYMLRCTEAILQCFSIGFANQDASVSDIRQILEQLATSIAGLSALIPGVKAELLLFGGSMVFADQLKEFASIMKETHGMLVGLANVLRDVQPTKTHQLFFTYLERPIKELNAALMHVLWYTYCSMRQPTLACCFRPTKPATEGQFDLDDDEQDAENASAVWLFLKGIFFGEPSTVPRLPATLDMEPFQELERCIAQLRRKYSEARVHILYGVVVEDQPSQAGDWGMGDDNHRESIIIEDPDFPDETRFSRLVSVDQAVMRDTERYGFMNIFARATFVLQLIKASSTLNKLSSVVEIQLGTSKRPVTTRWQAFKSLWPTGIIPAKIWPGRPKFLQHVKLSATISLATLIVMIPEAREKFPQPHWLLFSIAVVMGDFTASSYLTGKQRLEGTALGAMFASFIFDICEVTDPDMILLALALWSFVVLIGRTSTRSGYASLVASFTAVIVLLNPGDPDQTAWIRIRNTMFGIIGALVVDNLVLPSRSDELLRTKLTQATGLVKEYLDAIDQYLAPPPKQAEITVALPEAAVVARSNAEGVVLGDTTDTASKAAPVEAPPTTTEVVVDSMDPSMPEETVIVGLRDILHGKLDALFQEIDRLVALAANEPRIWQRPFPVQSYRLLADSLRTLGQFLAVLQHAISQLPASERKKPFVKQGLNHAQTLRTIAVETLRECLTVLGDLQEGRKPPQVVALLSLRSVGLQIENYVSTEVRQHINENLHRPVLDRTADLPFNAVLYCMCQVQLRLLEVGQAVREIVARESGALIL